VKPKLLLIDGDIFAYRYAAVAEVATHWGEGLWTLHADEGLAWDNMRTDIESSLTTLEADKLIVCLSSSKSFRKEWVYPAYKSNRDGVRRPMVLSALKQHIRANYETSEREWLEADDVMGIIATDPLAYPDYDKVIVSADKDMMTIPTAVWNMKFNSKGKPIINYITEDVADHLHRVQTLTGDVTDGYPGCKGIGAVRAERIANDGWDAVFETFIKAGHDMEYALSQARCSRILRASDYDFKKEEPILWTPPSSPVTSATTT